MLAAADDDARQHALGSAYELVARRRTASGLTAGADRGARLLGWPFVVLTAGRFVTDSLNAIEDDAPRHLPPLGSVDQFVDSTAALEAPDLVTRLKVMYEAHLR